MRYFHAGINPAANLPFQYYWTGAAVPTYSGRVLPNALATVPPTKNLIPDPFDMIDEQGDTTPTRFTTYSSTIVDPLGTKYANIAGWTAQFQPLTHLVKSNSPGLPADNYTSRVQIKKADLTTGSIGIGSAGANTGQWNSVTISDTWQTLEKTNVSYSGASAFDLGIRQDSGGGTVNAALFCLQMYDSSSTIPTPAEELAAAQAGHVKAPAAYVNSIPVGADGWIDPSLDVNFNNLVACFPKMQVDELTIGGWMDVVNNTTGSTYGHLIGVSSHLTGVNNTKATLGFYKDTYRLYANPGLSSYAGSATNYLLGQGRVFLLVTAKATEYTAYVNGVPVLTSVGAGALTSFVLERLTLMAYDGSKRRTQKGNYLSNKANHFIFTPKWLSQTDVTRLDAYARRKMIEEGGAAGPRKMAVIGCGDSLTAFTPSPFWNLEKAASLRPGTHTYLDAAGASKYGAVNPAGTNYNSDTRQGFRRQMMKAALAAGFEKVFVHWQYGTNDLVGGVMDVDQGRSWEEGRNTIDAMIQADHVACDDGTGRLKKVIVTIPAHGTLSAGRNAARLAYNADRRLNYQAQGYDYLIDLASYVPAGFSSLEAAAIDAATNGANSVFLGDGIHWSTTGGQDAATNVFVPFYQQFM